MAPAARIPSGPVYSLAFTLDVLLLIWGEGSIVGGVEISISPVFSALY
jgi:hypothetical protein